MLQLGAFCFVAVLLAKGALDCVFRPGDDFFLIYNEGRQVGCQPGQVACANEGQKDRSLKAKLTYSFDF